MSLLGSCGRRPDLLAYVPLAATTTAAAVLGRERIHLISKVLLAPTLCAGVLATRDQRPTSRTVILAAALAGSTVGDWFMNGSGRADPDSDQRRQLMRRGAGAFAVQQSGLIQILLADGVRPHVRPTTAVGVVMMGLAALDRSGSGEPDPVLTGYGLLLGSMAALAMSDSSAPRHRRLAALGGGLFLLSDAAIIVGEHLATTPTRKAAASGLVLSTYTAALALLVHSLRNPLVPEADLEALAVAVPSDAVVVARYGDMSSIDA